MMFDNFGMMSGGGIQMLLVWFTWVLVIIALIMGNIWLWQQINKKK